jgi:hypothetical protein
VLLNGNVCTNCELFEKTDDGNVQRHVRVKDVSKVQKSEEGVKDSSGIVVEEGGKVVQKTVMTEGHRSEDEETDEGRRIVETG